MQPVEQLVSLPLVKLEVARGVKGDIAHTAPIGPDPQRDLLTHRAAGHEDGRLLAKQCGDLTLESLDQLALAVTIVADVRADPLGQLAEDLPGRPAIVMSQKA